MGAVIKLPNLLSRPECRLSLGLDKAKPRQVPRMRSAFYFKVACNIYLLSSRGGSRTKVPDERLVSLKGKGWAGVSLNSTVVQAGEGL